jgi:hypothetical protein
MNGGFRLLSVATLPGKIHPAQIEKIKKPPKHRELCGFFFHTKTLAISIKHYHTSSLTSRAKKMFGRSPPGADETAPSPK